MAATIGGFRLTRFEFPRGRVIGDSQVRFDMHYIGALELLAGDGQIGLGFFGALMYPLPPLAELERVFHTEVLPSLRGQSPFTLLNRQARPRGGNIRSHPFGQAVDQALWDLAGKELDLQLYRLLGGVDNRVRAYASGLDFHLTPDEFLAFFAHARERGFTAFKIKVGHPDLARDLERLRLLREVVGPDATVMVDANEAWSPKEAIRRAHAYRDAGFAIYWLEDPCLRDDFAGLARVAEAVPFALVNSGEYLDLRGKRFLLEHRGVDILNVHGTISDSLRAAWLAAEYGIPVSLGNTPFEIGVHLAAALPEAHWLEYSFQDYDQLVAEPVVFEQGYALAPDRPGHGLALAAAAGDYARPDVGRGS
ncbi:MAG TPA: mandelate racemase/muconate lactonizing enzyme family protein [Thermomicrobiales bacterium]|nr:mandelate racemase/muconate lactonizing enzyme family protein [Thermomicrobiales bacterium]